MAFPKTFAAPPAVNTTANSGNALHAYTATVFTITETDCAFRQVDDGNVFLASPLSYHAIGEWDGVS
jgi:hypothetical protein